MSHDITTLIGARLTQVQRDFPYGLAQSATAPQAKPGIPIIGIVFRAPLTPTADELLQALLIKGLKIGREQVLLIGLSGFGDELAILERYRKTYPDLPLLLCGEDLKEACQDALGWTKVRLTHNLASVAQNATLKRSLWGDVQLLLE